MKKFCVFLLAIGISQGAFAAPGTITFDSPKIFNSNNTGGTAFTGIHEASSGEMNDQYTQGKHIGRFTPSALGPGDSATYYDEDNDAVVSVGDTLSFTLTQQLFKNGSINNSTSGAVVGTVTLSANDNSANTSGLGTGGLEVVGFDGTGRAIVQGLVDVTVTMNANATSNDNTGPNGPVLQGGETLTTTIQIQGLAFTAGANKLTSFTPSDALGGAPPSLTDPNVAFELILWGDSRSVLTDSDGDPIASVVNISGVSDVTTRLEGHNNTGQNAGHVGLDLGIEITGASNSTVVPLPAGAYAGFSLLGLLGAAKLNRRRQA